MIGFDFYGYGECGVNSGGNNKHILVSPGDTSKTTAIRYPETVFSVCDKDWRYDNPFSCGTPANYTHIAYAKWRVPNSGTYYETNIQLWDSHPPKWLGYGVLYSEAWLSVLQYKIASGEVEIKINDMEYGMYIDNTIDNVLYSHSFQITGIASSTTVSKVNKDIAECNDMCTSGVVNPETRPLIVCNYSGGIRITVTLPSGKTKEVTLQEGENVNYARLLFDSETGEFCNCSIAHKTGTKPSPF